MLLEAPIRTHRTLEHDTRLRHGHRHDVRILALLSRALVKEIAVRAPGFQAAFIEGAAIARSKNPSEVS
jgi:hypothetical protein